jgi:enoyl-CoA hydratase/carnithine racemase
LQAPATSPRSTAPDADASDAQIDARVINRIGVLALNRPEALNALSHEMISAMHRMLDQWRDDPNVLAVLVHSPHPRAFCAGGDVRYVYHQFKAGRSDAVEAFFVDEYRLDHAIFTYPKPYVALMSGVVMGGGMGISQGAPRTGGVRVVTDSTRMAMPETRIGLFPDVGAGWFLSRAPGALGAYLAVVGETIGAADALHAQLADLYVPQAELEALVSRLTTPGAVEFTAGTQVVEYLREAAQPPRHAPLADMRAAIERHFSRGTVGDIAASLRADVDASASVDPPTREWAARTVATMAALSPLSMAVALELVRRAAGRSMAECLRTDLTLTRRSFEHGDVIEGIRARLVDKDNAPRWSPSRVEEVDAAMVASMFEAPWADGEHPLRDLQD